jgi:uncharacterized membrane protein
MATGLLAAGAGSPSEYLPYFLLLGFSEAWLSGMLSTLFAVYRPELLADFEDAQFFGRR